MRGDVLNTLTAAPAPLTAAPAPEVHDSATTLYGDAAGLHYTYSAQAMGAIPTWRLNNTGSPAPHTVLPRRLFAFWDSTPIPAIAAACVSLMKDENPAWRMELLD